MQYHKNLEQSGDKNTYWKQGVPKKSLNKVGAK